MSDVVGEVIIRQRRPCRHIGHRYVNALITECRAVSLFDEFNGYTVLAHGVGLCDEYPSLFVRESWAEQGFDGVIEVGNIHAAPPLQRTAAATEAMFLMMARVFDELGYRRYEWKCDALNGASRRAAERLGFVFEGVFRQATLYKGRNRDTAWYAIIDKDWPAVRHAFETWLDPANFCVEGRQRRSLSAVMVDRAARISLVVP